MDPSVKQALAKWPDVPAVYGWLSLDERGRWRIHEQGDAHLGDPGDLIANPQILAFINRNYGSDAQGRWYFQNGPQRVYVRLDAAPYILRQADTGTGLITHTTLPVRTISGWWLDRTGRLYARTDAGAGMIEDRDLGAVLGQLKVAPGGACLVDVIEPLTATGSSDAGLKLAYPGYAGSAPLASGIDRAAIGGLMGFVAHPRADQQAAQTGPDCR